MNEWRLLRTGAARGAWQMALDVATLEAREANRVPPTLRLYRFSPPAVTIGRFQDASDVDLEACLLRGLEVARRPTGGRGVLHAEEVTYSVVASTVDGVPRGVAASYKYLCGAVIAAFSILGLSADLGSHPDSGGSSACYLRSTRADVCVGTSKISGSAQVWRGSTVLQHGSFVLSRDFESEGAVFRFTESESDALASKTTTILGSLGATQLGPDAVEEAAVRGFEEALGVSLGEGTLSTWEIARATELEPTFAVGPTLPSVDRQGPAQVDGV